MAYQNRIATQESKTLREAIAKLEKRLREELERSKQIKQVLRVPRLYHQFQDAYEKVLNEQQLKMYTESKLKLKQDGELAEISEYGMQCLATALRQQFVAEFDLKRIKDDILHNIDRSLLGISTSADDVENRSLQTSMVNTVTANSTARRHPILKLTPRIRVPKASNRGRHPQTLNLEDSILSDFKKN